MDTKALRQKILDLAIRGKLVPQDPNDEPASVLIERIRAEKLQMVKDGKLKPKDIKNDTIIFKGDDNLHYEKFSDGNVKCIEDEIPFEVPEGWAWTRFLAITINRDSERKPISASQRTDVEKIYDYYGASGKIDKIDKYIFDEKLLLIGEDGANLVTRSKPIAFFAEGKYWVNNHAHCIDSPDKSILQFICFFINAISLEKYVTGSAQPKMTQDNMNSILVALPPYKEQQLISQQLDIIWVSIDKIEFEKENVLKLVDNAKSKILDLAIRGKLVLQNPYDEPASVLIERIRVEKEELIKQGKIKRDKKESVIFKGDDNSYYEKISNDVTCIDDEISFDIPDTWSWTRISTITDITMGSSPKSQDICNDNQYIEFHQGKIYFSKKTLMKSNQYTRKTTKLAPKQSVLLCVRAPVGELNITDRDICIGRGLASIKSLGNINEEFIFYWLHPYKTYLVNQSTGSTFSAITSDTVRNILIPLPPLMEQKEILNKIQKVFTLLENLETVN